MSVDYISCDSCGSARYEEFVHECSNCGRSICENCFSKDVDTPERISSKDDITQEQYDSLCERYGQETIDKYVISWGELNPDYCPFCFGQEVHNDDLLEFLLDKLGLSKESAIEMFKEAK